MKMEGAYKVVHMHHLEITSWHAVDTRSHVHSTCLSISKYNFHVKIMAGGLWFRLMLGWGNICHKYAAPALLQSMQSLLVRADASSNVTCMVYCISQCHTL